MLIAIDTGGTFTDLVSLDRKTDKLLIEKVPSTPSMPAEAVLAALAQLGCLPEEIERLTVSSTAAINAILQRNGAEVILLATAGFEDIPHIQRINRPHAYDLQWMKAQPLVRRSRTIGVVERMDHHGRPVVQLSDAEIATVVERVARLLPTLERPALAIALLFSYVNPSHEVALVSALESAFPELAISASHRVAPVWREYERTSTTLADAYVKPIVAEYATTLGARLRSMDIDAPVSMMRSNGGQSLLEHAGGLSAQMVLSGLAGGLLAGKYYADLLQRPNLVTLDMGGTSCDVGVINHGSLSYRENYEIEFAIPIIGSFVDMTTIGAGGSSLVGFDRGGLLAVGPESAGADPGPAAYGRGGSRATVTDANLVLGRLDPAFFLAGKMQLDVALAERAVARIASHLGTSLDAAAMAIVRLANENMANAVRLLTVDRGLDHRSFDLVTFGGAGPLHASELANALGMSHVIVPIHPGVASAFGLLVAAPRVDRRMTRGLNTAMAGAAERISSELRDGFRLLTRQAESELQREGYAGTIELTRTVSMRYLGQNYEQEVALPPGDIGESAVDVVIEGFHRQHEAFYGYAIRDNVCELIHLNVTAKGTAADVQLPALPNGSFAEPIARRRVRFLEEGWLETPIYRRETLPPGPSMVGPAIVQEIDSTTVVGPGDLLEVDDHGVLLITLRGAR